MTRIITGAAAGSVTALTVLLLAVLVTLHVGMSFSALDTPEILIILAIGGIAGALWRFDPSDFH